MYTGQYKPIKKPIIPPSYRGNAFAKEDCGCSEKKDDVKKPALCSGIGEEKILLISLIVILTGAGADELTLLILYILLFCAIQ